MKQLGADKIVVPDPKLATDEDYRKVFQKLGLPETADKYELKVAEGKKIDENIFKGFKEAAHKLGVLPKQAQAILDWYGETANAKIQESQQARAAQQAEGLDNLRREWGEGWDTQVAKARAAVQEYGGDELKAYLDSTGQGNDPVMIKLFAKLGAGLSEDKIPTDGGERRMGGLTPDEAQTAINRVMGDRDHPYHQKSHPNHGKAVEEMNKLFSARFAGSA